MAQSRSMYVSLFGGSQTSRPLRSLFCAAISAPRSEGAPSGPAPGYRLFPLRSPNPASASGRTGTAGLSGME
jgi:hypothetical protein